MSCLDGQTGAEKYTSSQLTSAVWTCVTVNIVRKENEYKRHTGSYIVSGFFPTGFREFELTIELIMSKIVF